LIVAIVAILKNDDFKGRKNAKEWYPLEHPELVIRSPGPNLD
jgi:hypothetical protein